MTLGSHSPSRENLVRVTRSVAEAFHYKFKWGWAIFTVNMSTGELTMQSDWGDFSHRWNTDYIGEDLDMKSFLGRSNSGYIANKFQVKDQEIDEDKTREALEKEICKLRREKGLEQSEARFLWEDLENVEFLDESTFFASWTRDLDKALGPEPWYYFVHCVPHQYQTICNIIDLFIEDLGAGRFDEETL